MARRVSEKEMQSMDIVEDPYAGLNPYWKKFFLKFEEINDPSLVVDNWTYAHVIGYIRKRYSEAFKTEFIITIKGTPSKSTDVYLIKNIIASLGTQNMSKVKKYIDWVFDYKVIPKNVKFRKMSFFLTSGFFNEFTQFYHKKETITRSTLLPQSFIKIADDFGITITTYGDLAFVQMAAERNPEDRDNPKNKLISNLQVLGLDLKELKGLS
jgi:hypothetical protein